IDRGGRSSPAGSLRCSHSSPNSRSLESIATPNSNRQLRFFVSSAGAACCATGDDCGDAAMTGAAPTSAGVVVLGGSCTAGAAAGAGAAGGAGAGPLPAEDDRPLPEDELDGPCVTVISSAVTGCSATSNAGHTDDGWLGCASAGLATSLGWITMSTVEPVIATVEKSKVNVE